MSQASGQNFYRAFEDRYRGSRDIIKARLNVYRPFLQALAAQDGPKQPVRALDLGCGRGEWLELLAETGLAGRGVDLDEGMLQACRERKLDVSLTDALGSLRALPDASLGLVSAFHLVEHLPFEMVQDIIAEAQRVLQPGGLLILETPNPENLTVGASSFYLDPSHERPIPPQLLEFAVEFGGFERRSVLRLQEAEQLHGDSQLALISVLEGVSPDYAVVAQKQAGTAVLARFDAPFGASYGVTLGELAGRYESGRQQQDGELHRLLAQQGEEVHALHLAQASVAADLQGQHALNSQLSEQDAKLGARLDAEAAHGQALGQRLEAESAHAHALAARIEAEAAHTQAVALQTQAATFQTQALAARADALSSRSDLLAARTDMLAARTDSLGASALDEAARLAAQLAQLHNSLQALQPLAGQQAELAERLARLEARGVQLEQRIVDLLSSTSWRVTAPLRWLGAGVRAVRQGRVLSGLKRRAKEPLLRLVRAVLRRPRLKRALRPLLARLPALQARLHRMAYQAPQAMPAAPPAPVSEQHLSPRAQQIHRQLQQALNARKH